ncbi:MAG: radical SAM protein [bacterium]|nr:radical SAM protein [bacterium]
MKTLLETYTNGNATVEIYTDGTRTLDYQGELNLDVPLQVDLKITNHCDLSEYCQWCHEGSNKQGQHGDLDKALSVVAGMPKGSELAIGGGNPLDHPGLTAFLIKARSLGLIPNMTVNELHLKRYKSQLEELINRNLIFGLGISYSGKQKALIKHFVDLNPNTVIHVIAGIQDVNCLKELKGICDKVLVLGYKKFGKGEDFYYDNSVKAINTEIDDKIDRWKMLLPKYFGKFTLSFDNRAISQLKVKRYFTTEGWDLFYQGDEGTISFYIDAVKKKFAMNSTALVRHPFNHLGIDWMFNEIKKERAFFKGAIKKLSKAEV